MSDHIADDIYERLTDINNGKSGSIHKDLEGLSISEMEDYFGDMDPTEFL
jgi:hypothetical protein